MNHRISILEWGPNSKILILATSEGEVRVHDS